MKALAISVAVFAGSVAFATDYTWTPNAADPDNILTNACHFSTAPEDILPTDRLLFSPGDAQWNVTLPSGCSYSSHICPSVRPGPGGKVSFDLPQATWTQEDLASGNYTDKNRFEGRVSASQHCYFTAASALTKGAFRFYDANFSFGVTSGNVFQFDLNRGTFDMRAPNGVDLGASFYWPLSKNVVNSQLRLHAGSQANFPTLLVYAMCPTNEIIVDGGHHRFRSISLRAEDSNSDVGSVPRTRIAVSGAGTELALDGFATGQDHTYSMNVVSNAVLSFTGKSMSQAYTTLGESS